MDRQGARARSSRGVGLALGGLAGAAALAGGGMPSAGAVPATVRGWPVPGLAGPVLAGPGGGPLAVFDDGAFEADVIAFRPDGRVRWRNRDSLACGNCDDGPQPVRRQPDGTYGPLGAEGDSFWAVDPAGRRVPGCDGSVAADGTCVAVSRRFEAGALRTEIAATRAGAVLWRHQEPDFTPLIEGDVNPAVVGDGAGTAYAALPAGTVPSTGAPGPGRVVALDAATGAVRWRVPGDLRVLAGLPRGVLVTDEADLIALDGGGTSWRIPGVGGRAAQAATLVDARRGRVYVGLGGTSRATPPRVLALDASTGAVLWGTAPRDRAVPLSLGPTGRLYAATDRDGRTALRAITPAGRGAWQLPTAGPVLGAAEVARGRVGLTTGRAPDGSFLVGPLTLLIDPSRRAPAPRRAAFALTRTRVRGCSADVANRTGCTILRITLTRDTRLRLRLRAPDGRLAEFDSRFAAPRGTSWVRLLFGRPALARGPHVLEVRAGGRVIARLPFTVL